MIIVSHRSQHDTSSERQEKRQNSALYVPCSLVQIARVVVVRIILVGELGVMVVVLIAHILFM